MRDIVFETLYDLAGRDRNLIIVTADMGAPALDRFRDTFSDQFIDVGISEQAMVAVSAGLVLSGKKVFTYAIAPFATLRCYEALKVNFAMQGLPICIIGVGGGQTYWEAGPTHHTFDDVPLMTLLGAKILQPETKRECVRAVKRAYRMDGMYYLRLARGSGKIEAPKGSKWEKRVL